MPRSVGVIRRRQRCNQYIGEQILVTCEARYPILVPQVGYLNRLFAAKGQALCARCAGELRQDAQADLIDRQRDGNPFNPYEALLTYTTTLNADCLLSLYFDDYTYTGGAHGGTVRTSGTYSLNNGLPLSLGDMFPNNPNYIADITRYIQDEVARQQGAGEGLWWDNSASLVPGALNPDSFYLTPRGITVYFQQYDIAPYASGMPEFLIPWGLFGAAMPDMC